jgi:putative nucleotidyltransferase with HDIG domain
MSAALDAAREALRGEQAWVVGGAVRDRLLHRDILDVDLAVDGDVRAAARHLALQSGGPVFPVSEAFDTWRVMAPDRSWQIDLTVLRGATIEADLALRDFTVNAIAEPLSGGPLVDPHDGVGDVAARRLRVVSDTALTDDPLRVMRLARLAVQLGLEPDERALRLARATAPALPDVAAERVFAELRGIVSCDRAVAGLELLADLGAEAVVLPELTALRDVEQSRFHHRDVHGHTLEVLQATIDLEADPAAAIGAAHAPAVLAFLAEPLADELTRGQALRLGALFHDIAKPRTRDERPDGHVTFFHHDREGAALSREILTRLKTSEKLRAHVAALARHHLRLGFLVHERPLDRRAVYRYLTACAPVELDVTLLSCADRLATRGDNAGPAIAAHLELATELTGEALVWRAAGPRTPLVRGDVLAAALGIAPGPALGPLLAAIDEARFAGEVATADEAIALARGITAG